MGNSKLRQRRSKGTMQKEVADGKVIVTDPLDWTDDSRPGAADRK